MNGAGPSSGSALKMPPPVEAWLPDTVVQESKTLKVDATKPLTLKVTDESGGVTVTGADVKTVQVKAIKTARLVCGRPRNSRTT